MRQHTVTIRCTYDVTEGKINYLFCLYVCYCFDVPVNSCGQIGKGFSILWDCFFRLGCHLKSKFAPSPHISHIIIYTKNYSVHFKLLKTLNMFPGSIVYNETYMETYILFNSFERS